MDLKEPIKLGDIERITIEELKGLSFWGNINLPIESYEYLRKIISERSKIDSMKTIIKLYPAAITTFAVFMVRYKYNVNFWQLLATELDIVISMNLRKDIGDTILGTFRKYGFSYDQVKDDQRKYVEPVIYQACLPPESCLDDLFFAIKSDNRSHFDPQTFIEELINEKAYTIRKPLRNFLDNFRDTDAIEYILNIRDAMLAVEQRGTVESRYEIQYQEWNEQEKTKIKLRGKNKQERHQIKPFLTFEEGRRGLCIVLPWTILSREWIEEARWTVRGSDGKTTGVTCRVFGDDGKRYIDSITIPVYPAENYSVSLRDAENESDTDLVSWTITGIEDFVCFNSRGTAISSGYLPVPFSSLVIRDSVVIEECRNITLSDQNYPMQSDGYRSISVLVSNADALLRIKSLSRTVTLTAKPRINIFLEEKTLFSLPADKGTNLFTQIPDLKLDLKELAFKKDLEIRVGSKRIPLQCENEDEFFTLPLDNYYEQNEKRFGTYSIRLYQAGRFLRQTEFCYVPHITSDYTYYLAWPKNGKINKKHKFRFERKKDWELSFENCKVDRNQNEYEVTCPENTGVLYGSLRSMSDELVFEAKFQLPLAPLLLEIMDPNEEDSENVYGNPLSLGLHEFTGQSKWLAVTTFGDFSEKSYSVTLSNIDGIEQETPIRISANGEGICSLAVFESTLQNSVLPAIFEIRCLDYPDQGIPFLVVSNKASLQDYPVYVKKHNVIAVMQADAHKQMEFMHFGKEPFSYFIGEDEWYDQQAFGFHSLRTELPAGIYSLTDSESMDIFQLESDASTKLSQEVPSFFVKRNDSTSYPQESIHIILQNFINLIFRKRKPQDLADEPMIQEFLERRKSLSRLRDLDGFEIELLISLGYIVNSKISKSRKKTIIDFMKVISEEVLSGIDRTKIIRFLTAMKCPQSVFDTCNSSYSLFLFDPDDSDMKSLAEEVEPYSIDLAFLMLIDTGAPLKDTLRLEKYRSLLGADALADMMGIPKIKDLAAAKTALRKFLNDEKTEGININLSSEISGEMQPLLEMIEEKRNKIIFNLDKKPETGIYFNQIRFCDQYVNWYRLNHSYDGIIFPIIRERMMKLVNEQTMKDIEESINRLQRNSKQRRIFGEYFNALQYRFSSQTHISLRVNSLPRYFYLQGLAAFFSRILGSDEDSVFIRETGNRFLAGAYEISPRMVRRDILMASTYIYLKKKEEELCR